MKCCNLKAKPTSSNLKLNPSDSVGPDSEVSLPKFEDWPNTIETQSCLLLPGLLSAV